MSIKFTPEERRKLAEQAGIDPQYLWQLLTGRRDIDPTEAVRIERDTGGVLSRFDVCQKRGAMIWPEQWRVLQRAAESAQPATESVAG